MNNRVVVFIAFDKRENLGVRYLQSVLSEAGFSVKIIEFDQERKIILKELLELDPLLVGFSVIFENYIFEFKELIEYLRQNGVESHFTSGGHYASLRPDELFQLIPSLDSIVRFEGEKTVVELSNHLWNGIKWQDIAGISYKVNGKIVHNRLRSLEPDLDCFPYPVHSETYAKVLDKKIVPILAGRGCIYRCIFCDSLKFFEAPPGPVKRIRDPVKVVEEIETLYHQKGYSIFLFRDDDFPVKSRPLSNWIERFCNSIKEKELQRKIMWKISCRPDEITEEAFTMMKDHGLFKVFMGFEDGTDAGLSLMKKHFKVADIIQAIDTLKQLELAIDYGFMLFHPETTFSSLYSNLDFLEQTCGDGYMPVQYLKMMPYGEAEITHLLRRQQRLKGGPGFFDYEFHDPSMNEYYNCISNLFNHWVDASQGLLNRFKIALSTVSVYLFHYGTDDKIEKLSQALRQRISEHNLFLINTLRELAHSFENEKVSIQDAHILEEYNRPIASMHKNTSDYLNDLLNKLTMLPVLNSFFTITRQY